MKKTQPRFWWVIDSIILVLLTVIFGVWFFKAHAYGAWGDDSPGYIYTAGQVQNGEALVVQDNLVQAALAWFGDEHFARFVAPAHHEIISPSGWTASRYPIGLSVLMALANKLTGQDTAMYAIVPLAAVGVVLLTYLLAVLWLPTNPPLKRVGAMVAALSVGLSDVFANYAVAQPMREIPALLFWLAALLLLTFINRVQLMRWKIILAICAGLLFGYSINIRETSAVLLVPVLVWLWPVGRVWWKSRVERSAFIKIVLAGCAGLLIALSLSIWNSAAITAHKEKFREKDISSIAITSNFDHIQSLSPSNLFNNQGKFKPGVGGVVQYWEVMSQFSTFAPFLFFALIGLFLTWWQQRRLAYVLASWIAVVFILFAMWINPYARYILPLLPAVAILSAYGMVGIIEYVGKKLQLSRFVSIGLSLLLMAAFFISLQPAIAARNEHIRLGDSVYKAITAEDLSTLKTVSDQLLVKASPEKPALLMMFGSWRAGLPETIMTHSDLRVIRFPGRPNEQPDLTALAGFMAELQKTYTVYVWYDATLGTGEQRLFQQLSLSEPILTTQLSFQADIVIYALTAND
ncbi:MAG: hypothetical protein ACD_21C00069G0003 [uncultured bacterium]|nr:MAG: hypothetical protein ACD_21C00069G0003 [uncultured bacterium]